MEGFIILDFAADFPAAMKQLAIWVSQGQVKAKNTVVKGGLEKADQALADMFKGLNTGEETLLKRSKKKESRELTSEKENWSSRSRSPRRAPLRKAHVADSIQGPAPSGYRATHGPRESSGT